MDIREKIDELTRRINQLAQQQSDVNRQLIHLISELDALKQEAAGAGGDGAEPPVIKTVEFPDPVTVMKPAGSRARQEATAPKHAPPRRNRRATFEEIIGKNIASKVGILVTIVGIFIGARYAIEHNLVSPAVRIMLGYFSGAVLITLALYLKKKFEGYSAVLLGGGLAVLYFISYTAYSFYQMFPQSVAFALMLALTVSAVYASLLYDRVIIAHLGLVAAYAIPFLLSDNSGRYGILFSYTAIINAGILAISFHKYWKSLFYVAFGITWFVFTSWFLFFREDRHFNMALLFSTLFFAMFYATFLAYKLVKRERYGVEAVVVLLSNAFVYYAIGYSLFADSDPQLLSAGLFTLINAAIHFGVSQLIRPRIADKALYYLVFGLTTVFVTMAVPVWFDGNWVTLLWTGEAVLLFIIGRARQVASYEKLSYALLMLGFFSLLHDWVDQTARFKIAHSAVKPFANMVFATGLLVAGGIGSMVYLSRQKKYASGLPGGSLLHAYADHFINTLLLLTAYFIFFIELDGVFSQIDLHIGGADGSFAVWQNEADAFHFLVLHGYTMVFAAIVMLVNRRWVRSNTLQAASLAGIVLLAAGLLGNGMALMNAVGANYYRNHGAGLYFGKWNLLIRYLSMGVMAVLLYLGYRASRRYTGESWVQPVWILVVHGTVLGMLSGEYLYWAGLGGSDDQYKLGLSILWGIYALFLIVSGIRQRQKYLRMAAIVLFGVTLVKLFVYDLAEAGTITRTVSFISLGAILLLVSYLYNRYKDVLFGTEGKPDGEKSSL